MPDVFNNHKTNFFLLNWLISLHCQFFFDYSVLFSTVLMFKRQPPKKNKKSLLAFFDHLDHASKIHVKFLKNNANCHVHRLFVLILSLMFNFTKHNFHASNNLTPKFRDFYCNNQDKTVHCERVGLCE